MDNERKLIAFPLSELFDFNMISGLLAYTYRVTEQKFQITFAGSRGYFDHIEISCEGTQKAENRIYMNERTVTKTRQPKKIYVELYHSSKDGVRVNLTTSLGKKGKGVSNG